MRTWWRERRFWTARFPNEPHLAYLHPSLPSLSLLLCIYLLKYTMDCIQALKEHLLEGPKSYYAYPDVYPHDHKNKPHMRLLSTTSFQVRLSPVPMHTHSRMHAQGWEPDVWFDTVETWESKLPICSLLPSPPLPYCRPVAPILPSPRSARIITARLHTPRLSVVLCADLSISPVHKAAIGQVDEAKGARKRVCGIRSG